MDDISFLDGQLDDLADDGRLHVDLGPRLDPPRGRNRRDEVLLGRLGHVDLLSLFRFLVKEGRGHDRPEDDDDARADERLLKCGQRDPSFSTGRAASR